VRLVCYLKRNPLSKFTYATTAAFQILLLWMYKYLRFRQCTTNRQLEGSVGTVASYGLGERTNRNSISSGRNRFESSSKRPGRLKETIQPPTEWTAGDLNLEVRRPGREAEHPHSFHIVPSLRMSEADSYFCARPFRTCTRTSSYNKSQRRIFRHVLLNIYINFSFTQFIRNRLLYPWDRRWYALDRTSCVCVFVGGVCPRARLGHCGEEKNLSPPGIEPPFPGCPANSLSLKAMI